MRAILTFHSVDDSGSVLSIAPGELASLIDSIRASGHRIVPLADLLEDPSAPARVALTFDDGVDSLREHALPVIRDRGIRPTLFLTTGWLGRDNRWPTMPEDAPTMKMLDSAGVEALHEAGWSIQAHTVNHPDLRALSDAEIDIELSESDAAIGRLTGEAPSVFAYPYGYFDRRVESRVATRYRFAVTAQMGRLRDRVAAAHRLPRLETFYFRAPRVHRRFGSAAFEAYLAGRALLRAVRSRL